MPGLHFITCNQLTVTDFTSTMCAFLHKVLGWRNVLGSAFKNSISVQLYYISYLCHGDYVFAHVGLLFSKITQKVVDEF